MSGSPSTGPRHGLRRTRGLAGYGLLAAAGCTGLAVLALPAAPPGAGAAPAAAPRPVPAGAPATGSANGVEQQSARTVAARARKAMLDANSLHARLTDSRARTGTHRPSALDVTLDRQGNCTGRVTLGRGGSVQVIKRGDEVWVRPDRQFWKAQVSSDAAGAITRALGDRYVHGTVHDSLLRRAAGFCDLDTFDRHIEAASTGAGALHKGTPTTLNGTRTVPVTGRRDSAAVELWVAAEGTPYPLKATTQDGHRTVTATLDSFNRPVPSATPSASDSVEVSKLKDRLSG